MKGVSIPRSTQAPRGHSRVRAARGIAAALLLAVVWAPGAVQAQESAPADTSEAGRIAAEAPAHPALRAAGRPRLSAASAAFDATYYHLSLDVRFAPNFLFGRTRVEGRAAGAPLETLVLDFSSTMQVLSVKAPDGTPLPFIHADDALHIDLPATVPPGAPVAVDVVYQGLPQDQQRSFVFGTLSDGRPVAWTLSEPYGARAWWPSKDHPSDKADSVRVTVTVPDGLRAGANGLLVEEIVENGRATYDWFSRYPISTYLVFFAAGPYEVHEQTYVRPDTLAAMLGSGQFPILHYEYEDAVSFYEGNHPGNGWKRVVDVMSVLEYWFGPYPFAAEKYGHAQMTRGGGMEHQTMTSMGGFDVSLISHELTHQWFGDLITLEFWPHLWLNEGFATYGELLYWQARQEAYPGDYERQFRKYYDRALAAQGTLIVQDTLYVSNLFNSNRVYAKGGIVLHMLRGVVGGQVFRQMLHAYTSDPAVRYGNATTADFQRVAEAVSGRDLDAFFRQWATEGTGYPTYSVTWSFAPTDVDYRVHVVVEQTQGSVQSNVDVFTMPVTLAIQTEEGEARFTVLNDQRRQSYTVNVEALPTGLVLDPDVLILRGETTVRLSTDPLPGMNGQPQIVETYPNPANGRMHVRMSLPEPGPARLALYDVLGREVRVLLDRTLPAGEQDDTFSTAGLAPGLYLLRLAGPGGTAARPVIVQ